MSKLLLLCLPLLILQCKSKDQLKTAETSKEHEVATADKSERAGAYLPNQVELKLQAQVKAQRIVTSFKKYGLVFECMKDMKQNIVILGFDLKAISREALVKFLNNEVGVEYCKPTLGCPEQEH